MQRQEFITLNKSLTPISKPFETFKRKQRKFSKCQIFINKILTNHQAKESIASRPKVETSGLICKIYVLKIN